MLDGISDWPAAEAVERSAFDVHRIEFALAVQGTQPVAIPLDETFQGEV